MIYLIGDIHGSELKLKTLLEQTPLKANDKVILLGDVSIAYGRYSNRKILKEMGKYPEVSFLILRGNHDTRYVRDMLEFEVGRSVSKFAGKVGILSGYENVYFLADEGGLYEIDGLNVLAIPGAYSIDKYYRLMQGAPYEAQEQLSYMELQNLIEISAQKNDAIDLVISHTAPLDWEPDIQHLFFDGVSQEQIDKTMETGMSAILKNVHPRCGWWFGHYHADLSVGDGIGHMLYETVGEIKCA